MAYHRRNHLKYVEYVMQVYHTAKERDIPDTRIVRHVFPKHGIFISYRQFMNLKAMKPSEYRTAQLRLF